MSLIAQGRGESGWKIYAGIIVVADVAYQAAHRLVLARAVYRPIVPRLGPAGCLGQLLLPPLSPILAQHQDAVGGEKPLDQRQVLSSGREPASRPLLLDTDVLIVDASSRSCAPSPCMAIHTESRPNASTARRDRSVEISEISNQASNGSVQIDNGSARFTSRSAMAAPSG